MNADDGVVQLHVPEQKSKIGTQKPPEAWVMDSDGKTVLHCLRIGPTTMQRRVSYTRIRKVKGGEQEYTAHRWVDATDFWPTLPAWARRGVTETLGLKVVF